MPASYTIDTQRRLVLGTASGLVTFEECRARQKELMADPRFSPDFSQLLDFSDVTHVTLTTHEVRLMAMDRLFANHARRVLVTPSPVAYGLCRMFAMLREIAGERGIVVVRSRAEADRLLGLAELERAVI